MVFFVTTPNFEVAEKLAKEIIEKKIAACVNIVPNITSVYRWKSNIEIDRECLMIIKTGSNRSTILKDFIKNHHPYENPECISFAVESGLPPYLQWIIESVK